MPATSNPAEWKTALPKVSIHLYISLISHLSVLPVFFFAPFICQSQILKLGPSHRFFESHRHIENVLEVSLTVYKAVARPIPLWAVRYIAHLSQRLENFQTFPSKRRWKIFRQNVRAAFLWLFASINDKVPVHSTGEHMNVFTFCSVSFCLMLRNSLIVFQEPLPNWLFRFRIWWDDGSVLPQAWYAQRAAKQSWVDVAQYPACCDDNRLLLLCFWVWSTPESDQVSSNRPRLP